MINTILDHYHIFLDGKISKKNCRSVIVTPDNKIWTIDNSPTTGNSTLYKISAISKTVESRFKVIPPLGINQLESKHICYSESKGHEGIWISTFQGQLYFLPKEAKENTSATLIYDGHYSNTQFVGLAYDPDSDCIWVANQPKATVLAFDASSSKSNALPKQTVKVEAGSSPAMLAYDAARKRIWVTHEGEFKNTVSHFRSLDGNELGSVELDSAAYGMAFDKNSGLYFATQTGIYHFAASDAVDTRKPKLFNKTDAGACLFVVVDQANYVWSSNNASTVNEYDNQGNLVYQYSLTTPASGQSPRAFGLACCTTPDTILIADHNKNGELILLNPIDALPIGVKGPFTVTASPSSGRVTKAGESFKPWKIHVADAGNHGKSVQTSVKLFADRADVVAFNLNSSQLVKTGLDGSSDFITTLKAKSSVKDASKIYASVRQPNTTMAPVVVYTANVGAAPVVEPSSLIPLYAWTNASFKAPYPVLKITNGGLMMKVNLSLTPSGAAKFYDGSQAKTIPVLSTNIVEIPAILTEDKSGPVDISYSIDGVDAGEQGHLTWFVNERADKADSGILPGIDQGGGLNSRVTITISGKTKPIKGVTVKLQVGYEGPADIPPHFYKQVSPEKSENQAIFTTDEAGKIYFGGSEDIYGLSAGSALNNEQIEVTVVVPIEAPSPEPIKTFVFTVVL